MTKKELNRLKTGDVVKSIVDNGQLVRIGDGFQRIYVFEFIRWNRNEGCVILKSMGKTKVELTLEAKRFLKNYEIVF